MTHPFQSLPLLPPDPIYGLQLIYRNDPRSDKINLSIGVLKAPDNSLVQFETVKIAEKRLYEMAPSKEYLPIDGMSRFLRQVEKFILGNSPQTSIASCQTVGGTGALYVGSELLRRMGIKTIAVPSHSWVNHIPLFRESGFQVVSYPYFDMKKGQIPFDKLCSSLESLPEQSAVLFQASCHNPTGCDPSLSQWSSLADLIEKRKLIAFFDIAYQGLGNGLLEDIASIRAFCSRGLNFLVASSFSKNLGIYNDRIGALIVSSTQGSSEAISSHMKSIIRSTYSSPPAHGAQIVSEVLEDPKLFSLWEGELLDARNQLQSNRTSLALAFDALGIDSTGIRNSTGLFCMIPLSPDTVLRLQREHGIYIASDGRINIGACLPNVTNRIANAIYSARKST